MTHPGRRFGPIENFGQVLDDRQSLFEIDVSYSLSVHRRNRADTSLIVFLAFFLMTLFDCIGISFLGLAILMLNLCIL